MTTFYFYFFGNGLTIGFFYAFLANFMALNKTTVVQLTGNGK